MTLTPSSKLNCIPVPFSIPALFFIDALEPYWNSIELHVYVAVLICSFYGKITFLYFEQWKKNRTEENYCVEKTFYLTGSTPAKKFKRRHTTHTSTIMQRSQCQVALGEQLVVCKRTANWMKCQIICSQRLEYRTSSALVVNIAHYLYRTNESP